MTAHPVNPTALLISSHSGAKYFVLHAFQNLADFRRQFNSHFLVARLRKYLENSCSNESEIFKNERHFSYLYENI